METLYKVLINPSIKSYAKFFSLATLLVLSVTFSSLASAANNKGESLFYAAKEGYYDSVVRLVKSGASVKYRNKSGETALHAAASQGELRIVRFLTQKGSNIRAGTVGAWLPLHHAVRFGHVRVASFLLHKGTPLYSRTGEGKTVFDLAKVTKNRQMIQFLESYKRKRK